MALYARVWPCMALYAGYGPVWLYMPGMALYAGYGPICRVWPYMPGMARYGPVCRIWPGMALEQAKPVLPLGHLVLPRANVNADDGFTAHCTLLHRA